jgi:hypothetical protein
VPGRLVGEARLSEHFGAPAAEPPRALQNLRARGVSRDEESAPRREVPAAAKCVPPRGMAADLPRDICLG